MDSILDAALKNAALAVPLAAVVLILGLVLRRPALLHVLWIVVLLRLVMPPAWNVTVPRPRAAEPIVADVAAPPALEPVAVATADLADGQPTAEENAPIWWQLAFEA